MGKGLLQMAEVAKNARFTRKASVVSVGFGINNK